MNPEQNPSRQCAACGEQEAFLTYAVRQNRRLCTDCLLKEHRHLFCPICLDVPPPPEESIVCLNCPSVAHLACPPPPPPPSSSFTCPPCSDPNFSFFPKSNPDQESADALVAAAKISAALMNNEAAELKKEAHKKIFAAKEAKMRAKEALGNLQDLVLKQKASEKKNSNNANPNPNKRKHR
ncbi:uncharacterized protein BNACNNG16800D [Brassica napus]|uniref:(rape) hypothetical protein n=1 Tax=Brassica napus TaxID=3708 RepID=A0A816Y4W7_BRANA|nr:uncharacterized protein BNACNNG16800D [Brassica napus]CAF2154471.1 unnamed protein product [Brassica napus]